MRPSSSSTRELLRIAASCLLLAAAAGCSSEDGGEGKGPGAGGADAGSPPVCSGDPACSGQPGYVCEEGSCVPACILHDDCLQRRGAGWVCRDKHCVREDELDAGPPDGGSPDSGQEIICDPPCPDNKRCVRGICVDRCQAPLPCPANRRIDLGSFTIDAYEASRPDATDSDPGCNFTRACSVEGRLPWTFVNWQKAADACAASGKRLCTSEEWRAACHSLQGRRYPYGDDFDATACNGVDAGLGGIWPGGTGPGCATAQGVYDLTGNVSEWIADELGDARGTLGGSFMSNRTQLDCDYTISREPASYSWGGLGFRCCSD